MKKLAIAAGLLAGLALCSPATAQMIYNNQGNPGASHRGPSLLPTPDHYPRHQYRGHRYYRYGHRYRGRRYYGYRGEPHCYYSYGRRICQYY